jgi:uncharacterized protein (TIGR00369 family)
VRNPTWRSFAACTILDRGARGDLAHKPHDREALADTECWSNMKGDPVAISLSLEELSSYVDAFAARRGFGDIAATLGLEPYSADGESISLRMPLTDAIAQANGMFSAAALFGAADITGTFLAMQAYAESGQFPLAVQSNQNFLSNSKEEHAIASARLLRAGGKVAVVEVSVGDAAGRQLMHATFTYMLSDRTVGR